jgi:ribokinase
MVDVAVVGSPFLDLTFEGLERIPQVGEELLARELHVGPGGTGMQAIGASRLGLSTALVAAIGVGGPEGTVRHLLSSEGVLLLPPPETQGTALRIPVTTLLGTDRGVAMATVLGGSEPSREDIASFDARALVISLGRRHLAPSGCWIYGVTGGLEIEAVRERLSERVQGLRALLLNRSEALELTERDDVEDAASRLAKLTARVIVTMGDQGAMLAEGTVVKKIPAPKVDQRDATGAGDLFVSAYVWADLKGLPPADCVSLAALYAGLSVRTPTALSGALRLDEFLEEARARGMAPTAS